MAGKAEGGALIRDYQLGGQRGGGVVATGTPYFPLFQPNRWRKGGHGSQRAFLIDERGGVVHADRMVAPVIIVAGQRLGAEACCKVPGGSGDILGQDTVVTPKACERIGV